MHVRQNKHLESLPNISQPMEEMEFKERTTIEFRRDVIKCLIYFFFAFIFFGILFVILSSRVLLNIEKQNRLFIDEVSSQLKDSGGKLVLST